MGMIRKRAKTDNAAKYFFMSHSFEFDFLISLSAVLRGQRSQTERELGRLLAGATMMVFAAGASHTLNAVKAPEMGFSPLNIGNSGLMLNCGMQELQPCRPGTGTALTCTPAL
jgi:hypothetical protein